MRWEQAINLKPHVFQRLTGISLDLFDKIVVAVRQSRSGRGRPSKLSLEDQVLLAVLYWKDYPILQRLGLSYGIAESTASRMVISIEDSIVSSGAFKLQGKKLEWVDHNGRTRSLWMRPSSELRGHQRDSAIIIVENIRLME